MKPAKKYCSSRQDRPRKIERKEQTSPRRKRFQHGLVSQLAPAAVTKEIFRANNSPVQCPGDQSSAFYFAGFAVRNRDVIHVQGAAQRAFIVGLGLLKVGERAQLRALRSDEVTLRENHVVNSGCSKAVFLLRRIERLLFQFTRFTGGLDLRASLGEGNICVADVQQRRIFQESYGGLLFPLDQDGAGAIGLRRAIAQGKVQGQLRRVVRKAIVKDLVLRSGEALLIRARNRRRA